MTAEEIKPYLHTWAHNEQESWYLNTHETRLAKTLEITPAGAENKCALEMGAYLQITPALKTKLGYGEVRGCYYGQLGHTDRRTVISTEGEPFECDIDLFDAEKDRFPYADEHFDTVLCGELIEHLFEDPMHLMSEINRILKPGGHVVLTTPNIASFRGISAILQGFHPGLFHSYIKPNESGEADPRHNREYTPREIHQLLENSGFEVTLLETGDFREEPHPEYGWVYICLSATASRKPCAAKASMPWDARRARCASGIRTGYTRDRDCPIGGPRVRLSSAHRVAQLALDPDDGAARHPGPLSWIVWRIFLDDHQSAAVDGHLLLRLRRGAEQGEESRTDFALYFLAGMLPWLAFSEAVGRSPSVMLEHRNFVKKLVFAVETLPVNLVVSGLVSEAFAVSLYCIFLARDPSRASCDHSLAAVADCSAGAFHRGDLLVPLSVRRVCSRPRPDHQLHSDGLVLPYADLLSRGCAEGACALDGEKPHHDPGARLSRGFLEGTRRFRAAVETLGAWRCCGGAGPCVVLQVAEIVRGRDLNMANVRMSFAPQDRRSSIAYGPPGVFLLALLDSLGVPLPGGYRCSTASLSHGRRPTAPTSAPASPFDGSLDR